MRASFALGFISVKKNHCEEKLMKFAFVILNYNTSFQTEKCLDAIFKRVPDLTNFKIAVLDNGSRDSSCKNLIEEKYRDFVGGGGFFLSKAKKILGLPEETT